MVRYDAPTRFKYKLSKATPEMNVFHGQSVIQTLNSCEIMFATAFNPDFSVPMPYEVILPLGMPRAFLFYK